MGPIGSPKTFVTNYQYSRLNNPEERGSHLLRGGSLKSRKTISILFTEKTNPPRRVILCIISSFHDRPNLNILDLFVNAFLLLRTHFKMNSVAK
jgi:hypothetical protein